MVKPTSPSAPVSRRALLGSVIGAAALTTGIAVEPAAASATQLDGTWKVNANGYIGDLVISHDKKQPSRFSGTLFGEPMVGAYSALQRTVVITRGAVRYTGYQYFIGQVSSNGLRMTGTFFATTAAYGASQHRIEYSFAATRGASTAPSIPPPPTYPAGPPTLAGKYFVSGTFNSSPQPASLSLYDDVDFLVGGQLEPPSFGLPYFEAPVSGGYARDTGTLFLCEYAFSWPGAIFVGHTGGESGDLFRGTYYKFEHIEIAQPGLPGIHEDTDRQVVGLWQPMAYTFTINHK